MGLKPSEYVLPLADPGATLETVGGKGASLARLVAAGFPVPDGFHVTTAAYRRFVAENDLQPRILAALEQVDVGQPATLEAASQTIRALFTAAQTPADVAGAIALAYAELAGRDPLVAVRAQNGSFQRPATPLAGRAQGDSAKPAAVPLAVRSSATAEDLPEASFAGQQDTFLNVDGYGPVLEAVKRCWSSLWTARAIGYRARQGIGQGADGPQGLSLAVVVQTLVPAEAAGILFTANPVTGRRDQAMISAAWGLGEAVVGGLVTPDAIVVDKSSGAVLERQIADKQVMTVRADGGTEEQPVPDELRRAAALDDETAGELVRLGAQIEELYGLPMDIEWALADGELSIVQARPITALPPQVLAHEPAVQPPTEWPLPDPKGPYMRGSIADFMPEPLTPLFRTVAVPAVNAAMQRTMAETIGSGTAALANYLTTINDYAYLYVSLGCRDWLWILFAMGPALPRLLRNAEQHWREVARPRYAQAVARWRLKSPRDLAAAELLDGTGDLAAAMGDYLTALQVDAIGAAAGSEGLFTLIYDKLVRREGDPPAATLLLGADSLPIQAEKALYDLAQWCGEREALVAYLLGTPSDRLATQLSGDEVPTGVEHGDWREWQRRFGGHLAQYGHSIYDLDFAKPLPADDPRPLLEAIKMYLRGGGTNPHERQQRLLERREETVQEALARVKGLKLRLFRWALRLAQTFALMREDSIFDIGLGYPVLRQMLHELGRRFAEAPALSSSAVIAEPEDIYWLERSEVERAAAALDRGQALEDLTGRIRERRALWHAQKQATPPQQLPARGRVMGIKTDAFMPVSAEEQAGDILKGVAASPGQVTATARVLRGPEDFHQMQPGDILVAEITTPAWTPLFAMAAGIVTDIGGPLSHGSIVAREYSIPAVLGTGVATQRIHSGQTITVDGSAGTVSFL